MADAPRPEYDLRVTLRCLIDDLDLTDADAARPVEELEDDVCAAFYKMRSQSPVGTEKVQPLENASEVYTLHAGEWRGATWHDRDNAVVWLLAAGFHRSGQSDDAYPYFKGLDATGDLSPTDRDYTLLFEGRDLSFFAVVREEADALMKAAEASPGSEVRALLGGRINVTLVVEDLGDIEQVSLAVSMSWVRGDLEPPGEWISIVWAAFFPWEADTADIAQEATIAGRPARGDEVIFSSFREKAS